VSACALILAAGRGERLRPLTDRLPKPLLPAGGKPLIAWQVEKLVAAGFDDIVINHAHLGQQIEQALGDGVRFGARIRYSPEAPALETAGGIVQALPLLGGQPFVVVSADIHTDFPYRTLHARMADMTAGSDAPLAHLVLVDNPPWHPAGDMGLQAGRITREKPWLTYGNIAVFHPAVFAHVERGTWLKLFPWMYRLVDAGRVTGERFDGPWDNVGTAEQLQALDRRLAP
jgi:MurNAc alpha-1-phosphate uridylyltransferase